MSDVRPGYKRTEVGVIPEAWEVRPFRSVIEIPSGQVDPREEPYRSLPLIAPDHIESNTGRLLERKTAAEQGAISGKYEVRPGDVVYSKIRPHLRKATLVDFPAICSADMYPFRPRNGTVSGFLLAAVLDRRFSEYAESVSLRSGMPKINREELSAFSFAVPISEIEQQAIAEALGDADALIGAMEALIAKRRDVKRGAMQELLTGERRLPGFQGKWEMKRLVDLASVDGDNLGAGTPREYAFRYVSLEDVDVGVLTSHSEQRFASAPSRARRRLALGDVLVSTVRPNLKSHLLFNKREGDWVCSTGFSVVRATAGALDPGFLFQCLFSTSIERQIETLLVGSNYPAINSKDVKGLQIPAPSFDEQRAIADVLSDMDAEIAALEQKHAKAKAVKQGMMQVLLTGEVRLV